MKILLLGRDGQLGRCFYDDLRSSEYEIIAPKRKDFDITNNEMLHEIFNDFKPTICINTIAFTDVSKSEIFKDQANLINNKAVNNLASACKKSKTKLVHFSTDYVFNGLKETPYIESDATNPLNFYGISKLRGERSIRASGCEYLIIRTSWVFSEFRTNFLKTILDLTKHKKEITVVSDQRGCPTYAKDISQNVLKVVRSPEKIEKLINSTYHFCGNKHMSWYEFAKEIFNYAQTVDGRPEVKIKPLLDPYKEKDLIIRPKYSVLSPNKFISDFELNPSCTIAGIQKTVDKILINI